MDVESAMIGSLELESFIVKIAAGDIWISANPRRLVKMKVEAFECIVATSCLW